MGDDQIDSDDEEVRKAASLLRQLGSEFRVPGCTARRGGARCHNAPNSIIFAKQGPDMTFHPICDLCFTEMTLARQTPPGWEVVNIDGISDSEIEHLLMRKGIFWDG